MSSPQMTRMFGFVVLDITDPSALARVAFGVCSRPGPFARRVALVFAMRTDYRRDVGRPKVVFWCDARRQLRRNGVGGNAVSCRRATVQACSTLWRAKMRR